MTEYGGNIGYLTIFNSMIFRMPLILKPFISPLFMLLETLIKPFQTNILLASLLVAGKKILSYTSTYFGTYSF